MTNQEYIELHPEKFKDDIDKWLFTEFNILGGCSSAQGSMEYSVARMVAEKMQEQWETNRLKHCDELTPQEAQIESDFVIEHLKKNNRPPTFIDAIKYEQKQMIEKATEWLCYNYDKYIRIIGSSVYPAYAELCKDFQKAMEE